MGKVKPAPKGAEGKDKKSRQANPPKRSPRTRSRSESIAGTPPKGQNKEKRRLVATLRGTSTSPGGVKHSTSTGRKLSALSANKRRLEGSEAPSVPRKRQLSSPQQTTTSPVAAKPTEGSQPMRNGAPPMTVAEAQELGEQARLRDETMWALEGLASISDAGKQESLATLADIYANRRNRLALHSSSLGNDFLEGIGKLRVGDDPVLALGAAAMLLLSTQAGGDPLVFAREDIAKLIVGILQVKSSLSAGTLPPPASRILRILHDVPAAKMLPREASFNAGAVALAALAASLDPHNCPPEIDRIKDSLRTAGVLQAVAQLAADQAQALIDTSPTMETVQSLWRLERSLVVLEHSCFACIENEAHLVDMEVTQGCPPMLAQVGLAQWLVQQVQALSRQAVITGLKKDCLRGLLAVLMNMTHNNESGCEKVVAVSGLDTACLILWRICHGGAHMKGVFQSGDELRAWLDEVNGCLGLLINCVEEDKQNRAKLRTMQLPVVGDTAGSSGSASGSGLVGLLSRLICIVMAATGKGGYGEEKGGDSATQGSQGEEVTLDALQHGEGEAAASIIEVYAAILLGFLVEGDKKAQNEAAQQLPENSMKPVISAVQKCLNFYVTAGALTQRTEASLRALLASLQTDMLS